MKKKTKCMYVQPSPKVGSANYTFCETIAHSHHVMLYVRIASLRVTKTINPYTMQCNVPNINKL